MSEKKVFDLRLFRRNAKKYRRNFRRFISRLQKHAPKGLRKLIIQSEENAWKEVDCLSCANCCKTMTPTFTERDIKRISAHFVQTPEEFKKKWLYREKGGDRDWLNKKTPCQFLDLKTNKCSIYPIRPADCAGFPHLRKNIKDYAHVHKQNIECCPATFKMIEKMVQSIDHKQQSIVIGKYE